MGTLRLRHCELLDACGRMISENLIQFQSSIPAFIRTCAAVNYAPSSLKKLVENHFQLNEISSDEIRNQIDLVWSLAILDLANQKHVQTVLSQDIFQLIQSKFTIDCLSNKIQDLSS